MIRSNVATNDQTAIPEVDDGSSVIVRMVDGMIVVDGAEGMTVRVYDAVGRQVYAPSSSPLEETAVHSFVVPAPGVYMVRVGSLPARKVVVIR